MISGVYLNKIYYCYRPPVQTNCANKRHSSGTGSNRRLRLQRSQISSRTGKHFAILQLELQYRVRNANRVTVSLTFTMFSPIVKP